MVAHSLKTPLNVKFLEAGRVVWTSILKLPYSSLGLGFRMEDTGRKFGLVLLVVFGAEPVLWCI